MASPLSPTDGVRVLLQLVATEPHGGAGYRGAVIAAHAERAFEVAIDGEGRVTATPVVATPVADPHDAADATLARGAEILRAIARTVARHALATTPPKWPRRVLRWRKV